MRLIKQPTGYLAVQGFTSPKGPANAAGWGKSRLEAMDACARLLKDLAA